MKSIKKVFALLFVVSLFAASSCSLIEEPDFGTEVGKEKIEEPTSEE